MLNTYKYTLLWLVREKNILIWAMIFPLILGTMFYAMFSNMDESFDFQPIEVGIVSDDVYHENTAFAQMIEALSEPGDDQMLTPVYLTSIEQANAALQDGSIIGYYQLTGDGQLSTPALYVDPSSSSSSMKALDQTILKGLIDTFIHKQASVAALALENPSALASEDFMQIIFEQHDYTKELNVVASGNSVSVRYFYALLGFSAVMCAIIGLTAITRTQANLSTIGARRAIGAVSRTRTLIATILATWTLSFFCLMLAFSYLRFVLGINFGQDLAAICGLFIASFMTTGLGALFGAIPKLSEGTKGGILTMVTCFLSMFAGLYGEPVMQLADSVARNAPALALLNPARAVCDLFYSLFYYDGLANFMITAAAVVGLGLTFLVGAAFLMRRQRYASL